RDLAREVEQGGFRRDLYFRLHVVPIVLPALRERLEDILPIARHFLDRFARQHHKDIRGFTPAAERQLLTYPWPGNVRELQNRILRAVILCEGERVDSTELALERSTLSITTRVAASANKLDGSGAPRIDTAESTSPGTDASPWDELRTRIRDQIELALAG